MRYIAMCLLALAGMISVGCAKQSANTSIQQATPKTKATGPAVGVVDVPLLLLKLGYAQKMDEKLRAADQQLSMMRNEALKPELEKQAKLQNDLTYAVRSVAKTRPDPDQETIMKDPAVVAAYQAKFNFDRRLQAYASQYQTALENYKRTLQESFQSALAPAMGKVGPDAGVSVILPRQAVVWNSAEVDLTLALEEHLHAHPPTELSSPPKWETIIVPMDKIQPQP